MPHFYISSKSKWDYCSNITNNNHARCSMNTVHCALRTTLMAWLDLLDLLQCESGFNTFLSFGVFSQLVLDFAFHQLTKQHGCRNGRLVLFSKLNCWKTGSHQSVNCTKLLFWKILRTWDIQVKWIEALIIQCSYNDAHNPTSQFQYWRMAVNIFQLSHQCEIWKTSC